MLGFALATTYSLEAGDSGLAMSYGLQESLKYVRVSACPLISLFIPHAALREEDQQASAFL